MPGRITRALRRLPVVPIAWSIAARVWWSTTVRPSPLPSLLQRLATGSPLVKRSVEDAIAVVYRTVPGTGRGRCLPRSLILYGLLHRIGYSNCSFCLGVQPETFRRDASPRAIDTPRTDRSAENAALRSGHDLASFGTESWAHAWVEVDGEPLAEPTDPRVTHRVLYRHPVRSVPASTRIPE